MFISISIIWSFSFKRLELAGVLSQQLILVEVFRQSASSLSFMICSQIFHLPIQCFRLNTPFRFSFCIKLLFIYILRSCQTMGWLGVICVKQRRNCLAHNDYLPLFTKVAILAPKSFNQEILGKRHKEPFNLDKYIWITINGILKRIVIKVTAIMVVLERIEQLIHYVE